MKIAYIICNPVIAPTNGILAQIKDWKKILEKNHHVVELINPFYPPDWKDYDVIHFFGYGEYMSDYAISLKKINPNIILSPICDPNHNIFSYKTLRYLHITSLGIGSRTSNLYSNITLFKNIIVRSDFEAKYMINAFGALQERIVNIPLSYKIKPNPNTDIKENFCLHISLLADPRKNVVNLIKAADKYKFHLKLAGYLRNQTEIDWLKNMIKSIPNIEYLGFISEDQKIDLYSRAKVFALPSINEGVGLVALDAAASGCNMVVTKLGGPHEYYGGYASIVDPYSVDEIGKAVVSELNRPSSKQLYDHITKNYSECRIYQLLNNMYENV